MLQIRALWGPGPFERKKERKREEKQKESGSQKNETERGAVVPGAISLHHNEYGLY
jgi:hypothetical protein